MTDRWKAHARAIAEALADLDLRATAIEALLARCEARRIEPGGVLCRAGDPGDTLFILLSGAVSVAAEGPGAPEPVGHVEAPEVLGALALLDHTRRSATCTATTEVECAVLRGTDFATLLRESSEEGSALRWLVLASLTRQLARTNARLAALDAPR